MAEELEIPDFLKDLQEATKPKFKAKAEQTLQVINMKSASNWGNAVIVPINGANPGESAIKQLNRVGCVHKLIEGIKKDGTPYSFTQRMYFFLDPKYYGELTADQEKQLDRIKSKFNQVPEEQKANIGIHQMTLIQGLCLKHENRDKPAKTIYEKIPALYIFESKNFEKAFNTKINEMTDTLGSYAWLKELTGRDQLRRRYLRIGFYLDRESGTGYQVSVSCAKFDEDAIKLTGGTIGLDLSSIDEKFVENFGNPIKVFLGFSQESPIWNDEYMNEIEVILNNLIRGEVTVENRSANRPQGNPIVPNSNSNFVEQSEEPEIPTSVDDNTKSIDNNDDLPF